MVTLCPAPPQFTPEGTIKVSGFESSAETSCERLFEATFLGGYREIMWLNICSWNKKTKERPQLITGKIQNISVSLARDFSVNVIVIHAPTACRNKTLNPPGVRMSEKVCVYLRWSVFGREEKESEVRVTAELDPQVTGAEASSQNDRFPHPPISSPGSHTLLVLTPALRYHTETRRSLCM